jgi:hypothetical protein
MFFTLDSNIHTFFFFFPVSATLTFCFSITLENHHITFSKVLGSSNSLAEVSEEVFSLNFLLAAIFHYDFG